MDQQRCFKGQEGLDMWTAFLEYPRGDYLSRFIALLEVVICPKPGIHTGHIGIRAVDWANRHGYAASGGMGNR